MTEHLLCIKVKLNITVSVIKLLNSFSINYLYFIDTEIHYKLTLQNLESRIHISIIR